MNREAKKRLKKLIFAGISILFMTTNAEATFVDANAVEEGLEYYIRIDKGVYDLGETIEMLCRVTNVGSETLNVTEPTVTYTISFELTRPEGDTLFAPAYITKPQPPGFPNIIKLNQGDYIEKLYYIMLCEWGADGQVVEEPFATVGQYSIKSKYDNSFADEGPVRLVPDALDFEIIPEPATIILLGLGVLVLKRRTFNDHLSQK